IAIVANATLDEYARAGRAFADRLPVPQGEGLKNIAIFETSGIWNSVLHGSALDFPDVPSDAIARAASGPVLFASGLVAFPYRARIVAGAFDPSRLVPSGLLGGDVAIISRSGDRLAGGSMPLRGVTAPSGTWPLEVHVAVDEVSALEAWYGSLPLYLFVILG